MRHSRGIFTALLALLAFGCRVRHGRVDEPVVNPEVKKTEEPPKEEVPQAGPREQYTNKKFLEFQIDPDKSAGRKGVELWYSTDGVNWTNHGFYDAGLPIAKFLAPRDGKYRVVLVPVDLKEQREYTPKQGVTPEFVVTVDTTPPQVIVKSPNGGEVFGAGRTTVVTWSAFDENMAPAGIRIEFSTGGDRWVTVARDLANTGRYHWDIPREVSSENYRIRVVATDLAGNEGSAMSDKTFIVDGLAPDLRLTGPALAMDRPVRIEWKGGDLGGAGLEKISLYYSRDAGQTWKFFKDFDPSAQILFEELDGIFGLILVGTDKVGNANPTPVAGTKPQMTLTLDTTKPTVKILSPTAGAYLGGRAVDVLWSAKDNIEMAANGITLYYSDDNSKSWKLIEKDLKPDGEYKWTLPQTAGDRYRVKVVARDLVGNEAEAISDRFAIDMGLPEARVIGPERSNSNTTPVQFSIQNPGFGKITKVTLYYSPDNGRNWFKYGDATDVTKPISFAHADGKYGLFATCVSEAGERSGLAQAGPSEGTAPQFTLEIDATPPILTLETFNKEGFVRAGVVRDIRWTMKEAHPDPAGMTILYTPDKGITWIEIASKVDPTLGKYSWTVPQKRGREHRIRLECVDTFGNKGWTQSEDFFYIDDDLPVIWLDKKPAKASRGHSVSVEYRAADEISGVARVELWAKPLGQRARYAKISESVNPRGTISGEVKEDGIWGFLVIAVDGVGHTSADPETDPKPDFVAVLDTTPPTIVLKSTKHPQTKAPLWLNKDYELEWDASDNLSAPTAMTVRIDASTDGGTTWVGLANQVANTGKYDVRYELVQGKRTRLRVTVFDEAGNEASAETTEFSTDDLPRAILVLRGFQPGQDFAKGSQTTLYWTSSDPAIKDVELESQKAGSADWLSLGKYSTNFIKFGIPSELGTFTLRVIGVDGLNQRIPSNYLTFNSVPDDKRVIDIRVAANYEVNAGGLQSVAIMPRGIHRMVKKAVLQILEDGKWKDLQELKTDGVIFRVPDKAGDYAIRVLATSNADKPFQSNEYRFIVKPPKEPMPTGNRGITMENFDGDEIYPGGSDRIIAFKTEAPLEQIRVQYSASSGRDNTWVEVPKSSLEVAMSTGLLWKKLPSLTGRTFRLRLYTDSGLNAVSRRDFAIDSTPPATKLTGPAGKVEAPVKLTYQDLASIAPIISRTLYASRDGGTSWRLVKKFEGADVSYDPAEAGPHGLYLIATSGVGLSGRAPDPGTKPQITVEAGTSPPAKEPAITTRIDDEIKGGKTYKVAWQGISTDPKATVTLYLHNFDTGKEEVIKSGLPASGEFDCPIAKVEIDKAEIRISLDSATGPKIWGKPSNTFAVWATAPKPKDVDIEKD